MSELISGKEALIALANGEDVECRAYEENWINANNKHHTLSLFFDFSFQFRLKPRTINLNGIEVPAPFEPPENLDNSLLWWVLDTDQECGYSQCRNPKHPSSLLGAWRTEEEIKQVVTALRSVFGTQDVARRMSSDF